jgi:hypothetical protein
MALPTFEISTTIQPVTQRDKPEDLNLHRELYVHADVTEDY